MAWQKVKLGKIAEVTSSKRIFANQYVDKGIPFYRQKEIIERNNKQDVSEPLFISQDLYEEIKKKYGVPCEGDLLITGVGVTLGIPYVVGKEVFYFKDGNLIWLKKFSQEVNSKFVYYYISSEAGQKAMWSRTIGAAQPALTIDLVKQYEIPLPPLVTQQKIADILSAYDDLIENNQKQIKLLEEAAQRLYRQWFIDLKFPGHETIPIVDGLPEGWKKEKLVDLADVVMGQSPKSEFYNQEKKGLPFHQGVGSYGTRFVIDETYTSSITRIAEAGSILFSVRAPVGRLNFTKNKIVIGRGLAAINHKAKCQSFLFYMLKDRFFKDDILGNGAIFASISKDELLNQKFVIPSRELMSKFNTIASGIDAKIAAADAQMQLLTQSRDRLLPKLMNGELEI